MLTQPNTLLVRFYGLHRVKLPRGRKIHYVVMENVFPPNRDMHETYDLKVRVHSNMPTCVWADLPCRFAKSCPPPASGSRLL